MTGVRFGNIHSYDNLGLTINSVKITPPKPKTYRISVPAADADIDMTQALTDGDVKYERRTITVELAMLGDNRDIQNKYSEVMNALHGKEFEEIVFDDDGNYYYTGRVSATALSSEPLKGIVTVQCIVDPYKYDFGDDWLWDPFSFETGIINEMNSLEVNGTLEVTYIGQRKQYIPTITVTSAMTVTFQGSSYNLTSGKNKIFDIKFREGINLLTFIGNGIVSIENKGGSL
ncbi:hypothetical protein C809_01929 [Lachnospiraceae bacterium MD335]|jgi:predicted phage tail component-like protein|nr:hypothetical protein C809_01929 [Lachnospiraceae bacterium MD335]